MNLSVGSFEWRDSTQMWILCLKKSFFSFECRFMSSPLGHVLNGLNARLFYPLKWLNIEIFRSWFFFVPKPLNVESFRNRFIYVTGHWVSPAASDCEHNFSYFSISNSKIWFRVVSNHFESFQIVSSHFKSSEWTLFAFIQNGRHWVFQIQKIFHETNSFKKSFVFFIYYSFKTNQTDLKYC